MEIIKPYQLSVKESFDNLNNSSQLDFMQNFVEKNVVEKSEENLKIAKEDHKISNDITSKIK